MTVNQIKKKIYFLESENSGMRAKIEEYEKIIFNLKLEMIDIEYTEAMK